MNSEEEAKKVMVQRKHVLHEEMLANIMRDLEHNLEHHSTYSGPESIFMHVKTNAAALLFLCQERKRDRDKRGQEHTKPVNDRHSLGGDID